MSVYGGRPSSRSTRVRFEGATPRVVAEVVVAFESAQAADRFAAECGHDDYTVAPIGFHVDPAAV